MKKSLLITLLILSLVFSFGCKKQEDKSTLGGNIFEPKTEIKTTGKIYAPSPEGIRPDNATKGTSSKSSGLILSSASSQTKIRTPRISIPTNMALSSTYNSQIYWYECDYYGNCWDSEEYKWYDCYYDSESKSCDKGDYWSDNPVLCCDSWGKCYDENSETYDDPIYMVTNYCDQCGNCYDYYGNYTEYDENSVNTSQCEQAYQYDIVNKWDACGNAYDSEGNLLFYDNYYYDFQACNGHPESYCVEAYGGPDQDSNTVKTPNETDFCDECGNCYDYYGNSTGYNQNYHDEYWCSQYYQYDQVNEWDNCGNAYDKLGNYLFYDNEHYDYKSCHNDYSSSPPSI